MITYFIRKLVENSQNANLADSEMQKSKGDIALPECKRTVHTD